MFLALVYDERTTRHAAQTFAAELEKNCVEITLEDVRKWNVFRKIRNWLIRHLGGPVG
jgi:hypothetical protein